MRTGFSKTSGRIAKNGTASGGSDIYKIVKVATFLCFCYFLPLICHSPASEELRSGYVLCPLKQKCLQTGPIHYCASFFDTLLKLKCQTFFLPQDYISKHTNFCECYLFGVRSLVG